jgi:hypothetical protein
MTHEDLIARAREHMKPFDQHNSYGVSLGDFTEARVAETARVFLRRPLRDDCLEVELDRDTGEFIWAIYHPGGSLPGKWLFG